MFHSVYLEQCLIIPALTRYKIQKPNISSRANGSRFTEFVYIVGWLSKSEPLRLIREFFYRPDALITKRTASKYWKD